ncbi:orotate phosphoribosyltransferase [Candidatus Desantisbacteria bacterium CG1_02_38_46]|uniref:Orotate phosphoribosyltransferase n=2 Tax=unclassified Candidatus Desantisiibacteriota TaxID=3106372 RepID=A0A1J4SEN8_9BACT|nr:MAG: orotate phosphoribosyltransferase [Candidatus Desantisbacteria bacterium CG1_02_38_46]
MSSVGKNVMSLLKKSKALLDGHFLLSSGLHSNRYVQCAMVLQYPNYATFLARKLVKKFSKTKIDVVVSPAIGGIIFGQEVARALRARAVFTEREEGKLALRRGFDIKKGEKVLVVEDVLTTGGSVREILKIVREKNGKLIGIGSIVNRSTKRLNFKVPLESILMLQIKTYDTQHCPFCKEGLPLVKPGSKK